MSDVHLPRVCVGLCVHPNGSLTLVNVNVDSGGAGEDLPVLVGAPTVTFYAAPGGHTVWVQEDDPNSFLPDEFESLRFDERPNVVGKRLAGLDQIPFGNVVIVGGAPGEPWSDVDLAVFGVNLENNE